LLRFGRQPDKTQGFSRDLYAAPHARHGKPSRRYNTAGRHLIKQRIFCV
jgi:hypothetical protein